MQDFFKKIISNFPNLRPKLGLTTFSSMDKYSLFLEKVQTQRSDYELHEQQHTESFYNEFFCAVCGKYSNMESSWLFSLEKNGKKYPCWREHLVCPTCHFSNRFRATVQIINQAYGFLKTGPIYLTENTTMLYYFLKQAFNPALIGSEFLGDTCELGGVHNGILNQDLTKLTFASGSFNSVLCFDVLEHVPDYEVAFTEIYRVLKGEGVFLFTVPFISNRYSNNTRATIDKDGTITHHQPALFHGDPLNQDGILCFQEFGWEMLDLLRKIGFSNVAAIDYWSKFYGYLGETLFFSAQK